MRTLLLVALSVTCASVATATPITELSTYARAYDADQGGVLCSNTGTSSATCDYYATAANGFGLGRFTATGTASFGSLDTDTNFFMAALLPQNYGYKEVRATAAFTDQLWLTGGSGDAYIQYLFAGDYYALTMPFGESRFSMSQNGATAEGLTFYSGAFNTPFTYTSALYPFMWNTPFALNVFAQAVGAGGMGDNGARSAMNVNLVGFNVFGADGALLTNYNLYSAANAPYATAPVPEPTTLLLLGSGLGAVVWRRFRGGSSRRAAQGTHAGRR